MSRKYDIIFVLFAASLFPDKSWVGPSMYFWGIIMVVFSGMLLKRTAPFAGEPWDAAGIPAEQFKGHYDELLKNSLLGSTQRNPVKMNAVEMDKVLTSIYYGEKKF